MFHHDQTLPRGGRVHGVHGEYGVVGNVVERDQPAVGGRRWAWTVHGAVGRSHGVMCEDGNGRVWGDGWWWNSGVCDSADWNLHSSFCLVMDLAS